MDGWESIRLEITLDGQYAEKLSRLAERMDVKEETLARSLVSYALDQADADGRDITEQLDQIPGAHERALLGRQQARLGKTVRLDAL